VYGLAPERIWVSVYEDDEEAYSIWQDSIGVPDSRIQRLGAADNFWESGATGADVLLLPPPLLLLPLLPGVMSAVGLSIRIMLAASDRDVRHRLPIAASAAAAGCLPKRRWACSLLPLIGGD
jgi:tRNA synthetases class II (A)